MNKKDYDELEKLTALGDSEVDEISEKYPYLDKAGLKRIEKLCERKMNMNISSNNTNSAETVEGVERIKHIPFYRRPAFAACVSIVIIAGAGAALLKGLGNSGNIDPDPMSAVITATSATEAVSVDVTDSPAQEAPTSAPDTSSADVPDVTEQEVPAEAPTSASGYSQEFIDNYLTTNGFNICDYPTYMEFLKNTSEYYKNNDFALYDLNYDGTPELIIYSEVNDRIIKEIRNSDLENIIRSNPSSGAYLCNDNNIFFFQGDPPCQLYTTFKYVSGKTLERIDCFTLGGDLYDLSNGELIEFGEGTKFYNFPLDDTQRIGTDSCAQYDLGLEPSDEYLLSFDEAVKVVEKYELLFIKTSAVSNVNE